MPVVTPVILAAGEGKRLGGPKALLPFGEQTLLEYVAKKCFLAGCKTLLIVIGAEHERILEGLPSLAPHFVINTSFRCGQTSSIKCALKHLPQDVEAFMLFPVDMPLVEDDECRALIMLFEKNKRMIVVPSYRNTRGHPSLFDITYKDEFLLLGDNEPAHKIIRANEEKIVYLETGNRFITFDIDTEEDYREALKELMKRQGKE